MYLSSLLIEDTNVYVTIGNDPDETDGTEDFILSPNRWKKIASAFGIGEVCGPIPVDADLYDAIVEAAGITKAVRDGAKVLSGGAKSRRELIHKLCDRGATRAHAEAAADFLTKRGYLNETDQAETLARSLLRRNHYGKNRIRAYLCSHGYPAAAVNRALDKIAPADWREGCMTLLQRKYTPWPADPNEQRKAYAAMARLGYTAEEVRTARQCMHEE